MEKYELFSICSEFRNALIAVKNSTGFDNKDIFNEFPEVCCGDTCDLLRFYLYNKYGIMTDELRYDLYMYDDPEPYSHVVLMYQNFIVDITGDQFYEWKEYSVYVDYPDNFYKNMAFRESQPFYNILNNNRLNKIYNLLMDKIGS